MLPRFQSGDGCGGFCNGTGYGAGLPVEIDGYPLGKFGAGRLLCQVASGFADKMHALGAGLEFADMLAQDARPACLFLCTFHVAVVKSLSHGDRVQFSCRVEIEGVGAIPFRHADVDSAANQGDQYISRSPCSVDIDTARVDFEAANLGESKQKDLAGRANGLPTLRVKVAALVIRAAAIGLRGVAVEVEAGA